MKDRREERREKRPGDQNPGSLFSVPTRYRGAWPQPWASPAPAPALPPSSLSGLHAGPCPAPALALAHPSPQLKRGHPARPRAPTCFGPAAGAARRSAAAAASPAGRWAAPSPAPGCPRATSGSGSGPARGRGGAWVSPRGALPNPHRQPWACHSRNLPTPRSLTPVAELPALQTVPWLWRPPQGCP